MLRDELSAAEGREHEHSHTSGEKERVAREMREKLEDAKRSAAAAEELEGQRKSAVDAAEEASRRCKEAEERANDLRSSVEQKDKELGGVREELEQAGAVGRASATPRSPPTAHLGDALCLN